MATGSETTNSAANPVATLSSNAAKNAASTEAVHERAGQRIHADTHDPVGRQDHADHQCRQPHAQAQRRQDRKHDTATDAAEERHHGDAPADQRRPVLINCRVAVHAIDYGVLS